MARALLTPEAIRAEAERLLAQAEQLEAADPRERARIAEAYGAAKGCRHVGACNCGKPCGCGRPDCTIPPGKRRHAKYRNAACKQFAFEQRHPESMSQTEAAAREPAFFAHLATTRPQLPGTAERRAKAAKKPARAPRAAAPKKPAEDGVVLRRLPSTRPPRLPRGGWAGGTVGNRQPRNEAGDSST